jgi:hypothetical protein
MSRPVEALMGLVTTFQRVPAVVLDQMVEAPQLVEEFLRGEEDSYAFDGYGNLFVDVSASRMPAWPEIHRRVGGLRGEARLRDGSTLLVRSIAIEETATVWRRQEGGGEERRSHGDIASLRLLPPLDGRIRRTQIRTRAFAMSAAITALPLASLGLYLQESRGWPAWFPMAVVMAAFVAIVVRAVAAFLGERQLIEYRQRRSKASRPLLPPSIDIDKAASMIDDALARIGGDDAARARMAISGGHEIAASEVGAGPALFLRASEAADVSAALDLISAEAVASHCPEGQREYVAAHFRALQGCFRAASEKGEAILRFDS